MGTWWVLSGALARLEELNRVLPRCVAVPGRITSAVPYLKSHTLEMRWVSLTVEYFHAGTRYDAVMKYAQRDVALLDWTPALLVDPEKPSRVFLLDFYV